MLYNGILKIKNKAMFGFMAQGKAEEQIDTLIQELPGIILEHQLLRTDKIKGEFITEYLITFKGQDKDELYRKAEYVGTPQVKDINFDISFETF